MDNVFGIYGMGNIGIELYCFIKMFGGEVLFFVDRDNDKVGKRIDNTQCISLEELNNVDKNISLVVAVYTSNDIEQEMRKKGFINVYGWREVRRGLIEKRRGKSIILDIEKIKNIKDEISQELKNNKKNNFINYINKKNIHNSMKIVEINYTDLVGKRFNGYELMEEMNHRGHSVCQIVKYKTSCNNNVIEVRKDNIADMQIRIKEYEHSVSNVWFPYGKQLLEIQKVQEADILHFHILHNNFVSLLDYFELMHNRCIVWTIHDPWILTGNCIYPLDCEKWKAGCLNCDGNGDHRYEMLDMNTNTMWNLKNQILSSLNPHIIVSCNFMKQYLAESPMTKHWDKIHVIPFGIDFHAYKTKIEEKRFISTKERITIGFRAEDMEIKGCRYIYDALIHLDMADKISVITVGSGFVPNSIKEKYSVIEKGWIDGEELFSFYSEIDLFIMPSLAETFGMMAIESMAAYTPVICFQNTVLEEIIDAPNCGIAVKYGDAMALAETIKRILTGELELESRAILGRKLVEEKYKYQEYVDRHEELYKKILSEYEGDF